MGLLTLLGLALATYTPQNGDDVGGPLRLRNEFPFAGIFLSTPPLDARIPTKPRLDLRGSFSSTYAYPGVMNSTAAGAAVAAAQAAGRPQNLDIASVIAEAATRPASTLYIADVETAKLDLVYDRPFGRRWMLEVEAPFLTHTGGWMDGAVKAWHGFFGFDAADRGRFPADQAQLGFARGGSALNASGEQDFGLGDISLRGMYLLTPASGHWPHLSASAAVKLPTGDVTSVFGSGEWDGGVGLHLTKQWGQSWVYGTVGYDLHSHWRGMSTVPTRNTLDLHLGYEFRVSPEWSFLTQVSYYDNPIQASESKSLGNPASLYSFAARFNDGHAWELEWGFIENVVRDNNTHDFGLYSRLRFWP